MALVNLLLLSAVFGFVIVTLILFKKSVNRTASLFLSTFYIIFSLYCLQTYIINNGLLNQFSWFYGWPLLFYALTPVPIYFYFVSICRDQFIWKWWYIFLFIPFIISVIDLIMLFLQPTSIRTSIIQAAIDHPILRFEARYGFFTLKFHFLLRHIWGFLCVLLSVKELVQFLKINSEEKSKLILNRWLILLSTLLLIIYLLSVITGINMNLQAPFLQSPEAYQFMIVATYMLALLIGIVPLYFPTILFGFPQTTQQDTENAILGTKKIGTAFQIETIRFGLDSDDLKQKLEASEVKQLFLQPDFNESVLAAELKLKVHHVSYYFNQFQGMSFATYRNHLRILHAKKLIETGYLNDNTIEALSLECGYASRSAFSKIFKSIIGLSPVDFAKANNGDGVL